MRRYPKPEKIPEAGEAYTVLLSCSNELMGSGDFEQQIDRMLAEVKQELMQRHRDLLPAPAFFPAEDDH